MKRNPMTTRGEQIFYVINNIGMLFLILITLYPMIYVIFASFSDPLAYAAHDGLLMRPAGFSLDGYKMVVQMQNIRTGFRNTIFYVLVGTAISMVLTILGAYVTSRRDNRIRTPLMIMVTITMFLGGGMIPTFLVVQNLGFTNNVWGVLLPSAFSAYNMIVLRLGFESIPDSLLEAAKIDGASEWRTLVQLVIPLSKASLATVTLFFVVARWSEWYSALVYLPNSRNLYPLQMFLREMLIQGDMTDPAVVSALGQEGTRQYLLNEIIKYAAIVITTGPILMIYPFLQKYFVKGALVGAVKG